MKTSEFLEKMCFSYSGDVFDFRPYTSVQKAENKLNDVRELKRKLIAVLDKIDVLLRFEVVLYNTYNFSLLVYESHICFSSNMEEVEKSFLRVDEGSDDVKQARLNRWTAMNDKEVFRYALGFYIKKLNDLEDKLLSWIEFLNSEVPE